MRKPSVFAATTLAAFLAVACGGGGGSSRTVTEETTSWERVYSPGYRDAGGLWAGGTEILQLTAHKGKLYATNGYWMDTDGYENVPWAQVLVLDAPGGKWRVDLETGTFHVRAGALSSVIFTTDEYGAPLAEPVNLLLAGADSNESVLPGYPAETNVWTRDDATDTWVKTLIKGHSDQMRAFRALKVYRDKVTGADRIFAAGGQVGIFSGVYDPAQPGKIRWDAHPEVGPFTMRTTSFAEANGKLYAGVGTKIFRRNDGPVPSWEAIYEDTTTAEHFALGGIRGLTIIPNPTDAGESILFTHTDRVLRIDPADGYRETVELNLRDLIWEVRGQQVIENGEIIAYNDMLKITDPQTNEPVHVLGVQVCIAMVPTLGCWYPGALYLVRKADQTYSLHEVNGRWNENKPWLVSTRTYSASPFGDDMIYFGGYDANFIDAHDTAWIYRAPIETVLGRQR